MKLTDSKCKNAKSKEKQYKLSDGKNLYLLIKPNGGKYWRYKYYVGKKEKLLSFGVYPAVTLKEARLKREEAEKQKADGIDPSQQKQIDKLTKNLNSENSFEHIAREWHETKKESWTERHANYVLRRLEADIFPAIGFKLINEIVAPELLAALKAIENRGAVDIAKRALQTTGQIFRYAVATGRAERDISVDLRGVLKTRKQKNLTRLEEKELPEFIGRLEAYDGELQTKLGLKLIILTMVRTVELRGARWEEIDLERKEWHIPAERMKMREKHIVPLSKQALEILEQLKEINGHREHVFPNTKNPKTYISENTLLYAMYRMGYHSRATVHGFRGTASTILNEHGFNSDHIERQLAHAPRNKVRAAYNHAQYLRERTRMMQWWADYLDGTVINTGNNVINTRFGDN